MTRSTLIREGGPPLYRQIEQVLRQELAREDQAGTNRFTESELMARFGVSRFTVRQALAQLSREGLIQRRNRAGTTANRRAPIEQPLAGLYSFAASMKDIGLSTNSIVLSAGEIEPDLPLRKSLALRGNKQRSFELRRVRLAGDEPLVLETIWLPASLVPDIGSFDLRGSIYDLLRDRFGVVVTSARESISPVILDDQQAQLLAAARGLPAFFVERLSFRGETPVELRRSYIRGDRYLFSVELKAAVTGS